MIRITLNYEKDILWCIQVEGHAGFAPHGEDIVCAAVSVLIFNTINAIEAYTTEEFEVIHKDAKEGLMKCIFPNRQKGIKQEDSELLLNTLVLGLTSIKNEYPRHVKIINQE